MQAVVVWFAEPADAVVGGEDGIQPARPAERQSLALDMAVGPRNVGMLAVSKMYRIDSERIAGRLLFVAAGTVVNL